MHQRIQSTWELHTINFTLDFVLHGQSIAHKRRKPRSDVILRSVVEETKQWERALQLFLDMPRPV